jgi:hypothetical protein
VLRIRALLLMLALLGVFLGAAAAPAANAGSLVALNPCGDPAYHLNGSRWTTTLRWSFRASSTPKNVKPSAAESALERGARNIVTGHNNCGLPDRISATEHYLGRTTRPTDVDDDATCGTPDGRNEVGFGKLPAADMALTCWWTRNGHTVEADIKLNKAFYQWTARVRTGCSATWSIEDVATHEFGHAFGLDHVGEALHGNLTMSPLIAPCQTGEETLGLGDVRGLEHKY